MFGTNLNNTGNILLADRINKAAKKYKNTVVGKTYAVIFEGQYIEVSFKTKNFLHLCGVDTTLHGAVEFYRKASQGKLQPSEIKFSKEHPFALADLKTQNLEKAIDIFKEEIIIISEVTTLTHYFKFGATDLDIVLCINEDTDKNDNIIEGNYIPCSLRAEDISNNKFKDAFEVDYVLSKEYNDSAYKSIVYGKLEGLPEYIDKYNLNITVSFDPD